MRQSRHHQIREIILASEDGLTVRQVAEILGDQITTPYLKALQRTMSSVFGLYVDRWSDVGRGQYSAVYLCIDVPKDTPHPKDRYK